MGAIDAIVILPVTTANRETLLWAQIAIRTCQASTKGRIFVMDNNAIPGETWTELLKKECELLGVRYEYFPGRFSTSKYFNAALDMTRSKYIAYGSSDLIFYPNWLENIIELWEEQPDWFCLSPFQFGSSGMSCGRENLTMEKRITRTHNVASGVCVMRRADGYRWDEQFVWQTDSDLVYHAEANNLKMGYCLNARVDHLIGPIKASIDQTTHIATTAKDENTLLRDKWGARYLGV